jgi:hypothetical protein
MVFAPGTISSWRETSLPFTGPCKNHATAITVRQLIKPPSR